MNAVVIAVLVMLVLSLARVNVVFALITGTLVGGLTGGLGLDETISVLYRGNQRWGEHRVKLCITRGICRRDFIYGNSESARGLGVKGRREKRRFKKDSPFESTYCHFYFNHGLFFSKCDSDSHRFYSDSHPAIIEGDDGVADR